MRTSSLAVALVGSFAFTLPFACSSTPELMGASGPPAGGAGGFNPGDGGLASASGSGTGSGASSNTGPATTSGAGGMGPPMCDDTLKRCDHLFSYASSTAKTVEVHGDFDAWGAGAPMVKMGATWQAHVPVPYNADVLYKLVVDGVWMTDPGNPLTVMDGMGNSNSKLAGAKCDTWTCDVPMMGKFDWRDAVLYFVFVDRFSNGNPANDGAKTPGVALPADYQGGDWAGVLAKVNSGYFTDLGVNTLWITVPVDNPEVSGVGTDGKNYSAYHGYWPYDLAKPEERFGSMADLKALVDGAHTAGLKVILDYAMNHMHETAPVYAQHPDWFWPVDFNGQSCICGSQACAWDSAQAKRCWFTAYLPDWNYTVDAARKYSVDNVMFWVKQTGADGLRLDAVKHIEDSWILDLRARVTADVEPTTKEHFYLVGETYSGDRNLIKYYVNPTKMLDGQFDFPFRAQLVNAVLSRATPMTDLESFMASNESYYGSGIMSTFIGNHDIPRAIHLAEDSPWFNGDPWNDGKSNAWSNQPSLPASKSPFERLANAFTILLTTKGVPLIYYGDEVGMPGAGDPDNRRMMQWSGYSQNQTFLYARVKKLNALRAAHVALRRGARTTVSVTADTYAYKMASGSDVVYVVVNRSDSAQSVGNLPGGALKELLTDTTVNGPTASVPARSSMVLVGP